MVFKHLWQSILFLFINTSIAICLVDWKNGCMDFIYHPLDFWPLFTLYCIVSGTILHFLLKYLDREKTVE